MWSGGELDPSPLSRRVRGTRPIFQRVFQRSRSIFIDKFSLPVLSYRKMPSCPRRDRRRGRTSPPIQPAPSPPGGCSRSAQGWMIGSSRLCCIVEKQKRRAARVSAEWTSAQTERGIRTHATNPLVRPSSPRERRNTPSPTVEVEAEVTMKKGTKSTRRRAKPNRAACDVMSGTSEGSVRPRKSPATTAKRDASQDPPRESMSTRLTIEHKQPERNPDGGRLPPALDPFRQDAHGQRREHGEGDDIHAGDGDVDDAIPAKDLNRGCRRLRCGGRSVEIGRGGCA